MSILSGILLSLIFPKFNLFWLAWFALMPLLYAIYNAKSAKQAALYGYLMGIPFYAITFSFILTLNEWVGWLVFFGWVLLTLFLSLYTALFAFLLKILADKHSRFLLAPLLWVLIEWLRSLGPFGLVPHIGYSQWHWLALIQISSLTGVVGIAFLIVLVNAILVEVFFFPHIFKKKIILGCSLVIIMGMVLGYGYYHLSANRLALGAELSIGLIQGNYAQKAKLDCKNLSEIKQTYLEMTNQSLAQQPQLILWPETSIPFYIQDEADYREKLNRFAGENKVNLLLGLPRYDKNRLAYNSSMFISSAGKFLGWQDKHQLVPFGEYLPFRSVLLPIFKTFKALRYTTLLEQDFTAGRMAEPIAAPIGKIGLGICSDTFFPNVFREFDEKGADYFFLITNDAWFKTSSAPYKHLMADVLLAVSFRRYFVQCANTGISAVIDPTGKTLQRTGLNQRRIVNAKVSVVKDRSFYSRFGEWFAYLSILILVVYALFRKRKPITSAA